MREKMPNPPRLPLPPSLILITNNIFKGLAHLVFYVTFNFNISASWQNIKNLMSNFGAIHVGIIHAKFQPSSFNGVGGE